MQGGFTRDFHGFFGPVCRSEALRNVTNVGVSKYLDYMVSDA